jgi:WD40 repeat protein
VRSGMLTRKLGLPKETQDRAIAFNDDWSRAATATGQSVSVWQFPRWKELATFSTDHRAPVRYLRFGTKGTTIVTASYDNTIKLWDVGTGREIQAISGKGDEPVVAMSRDGELLACAEPTRDTEIRRISAWKETLTLRGTRFETVKCLAFSPTGRRLASGAPLGTVKLWDTSTGDLLKTLRDEKGRETRWVTFSPDGTLLVSIHMGKVQGNGEGPSGEGCIAIWAADRGELISSYPAPPHLRHSPVFNPSGNLLALPVSDDADQDSSGEIRILDVRTGQERLRVCPYLGSVHFSPDGRLLACIAPKGTAVRLIDVDPRHNPELREPGVAPGIK